MSAKQPLLLANGANKNIKSIEPSPVASTKALELPIQMDISLDDKSADDLQWIVDLD